MKEEKIINCINCGSPVTAEICPYCGKRTGLESEDAYIDYPVEEANKLNPNRRYAIFILFAFIFGVPQFAFLIPYNATHEPVFLPLVFIWAFSELIALLLIIIAVNIALKNKEIKKNAKEIEATVYGYLTNNSHTINGEPALRVKLLIHTEEGYKFLLYDLFSTEEPYPVNSKLKLLTYENKYKIKGEAERPNFLGAIL